MPHRFARSHTAVLAAAALAACAGKPQMTEVKGACADVFGAQVCTSATMQGDRVVDVRATIPLASIQNAPAEMPEAWPPVAAARLAAPVSALGQSGIHELTMYWEAHGHPPGPYLTPHFDFHFYLEPPASVAAIDCRDLSKPASMPAGYTLPDIDLPPEMARAVGTSRLIGLCVPQMGMHALPAAEMESGKLFTGDMLVGYYAGKPIFLEPMLTKALLMRKASFSYAIPSVPGMTGPHPTAFRADWDAKAQAYHFVWSGFSKA